MDLLCFLPPTEEAINGRQFNFWKLSGVLFQYFRITRAIEILGSNFLALFGVEILQVRLSYLPRSFSVYDAIHEGHGWFVEDAAGGQDNLEAVRIYCEEGFIFPGQEDVA